MTELVASNQLQKHITQTYNSLRIGIGIAAFTFPLIIWFGGLAFGVELQRSLSVYYHYPMRNAFVGVLVMIGAFLYLYKGFSKKENYALNAAGVFAMGVAFFPTSLPEQAEVSAQAYALVNQEAFVSPMLHGICAIAFFLLIAYVCIFRSNDTLTVFTHDEASRSRYQMAYKIIGCLMVVLPLATLGILMLIKPASNAVVFTVELVAVWVFGVFWLTKSRELRRQQSENVEYEVLTSQA